MEATMMDSHLSLPDESLMGLQELDSQLSMFESLDRPEDLAMTDDIPMTSTEAVLRSTETGDGTVTALVHQDGPAAGPDSADHDGGARAWVANQRRASEQEQRPRKKQALTPGAPSWEGIRESMASTMTTDLDDASSALLSLSSIATTPTDFDAGKDVKASTNNTSRIEQRSKYNVRPRLSIPADLSPAEYARQCVAAAEASRLNPYSLHPEELSMLQAHLTPQQVTTYLHIRNGILRLWVRNSRVSVLRDEAIGCAKDMRWFDVAAVCHEWLVRRGYINFGCLEHAPAERGRKKSKSTHGPTEQKIIVVIGAGMSGLGCARQLEALGAQFAGRFREKGQLPPRVLVLEGRNRIGGRVYSKAFRSKPTTPTLSYGSRHTAEMGGMIITGFDRGNPLNIIIRSQLALPYYALKSDTTIYDATGRPVDENRDHHAEELFNYILDRVSEYKFKLPVSRTFHGDRTLLDTGKEPHHEGTRTVAEAQSIEDAASAVPRKKSSSPILDMVPVSSDRLTGRLHLEPGIPAAHTAAFKAKEIGWLLRPGVGIERDLDLENAVNAKYATLGSVFDAAIKQYELIVDFTPLDLRLINWHVANLEYSNATTCSSLSLGGWDLDAGNEWEGKHTMVVGGYQQVPRGLMNCPTRLDVRSGSGVKKISHSVDSGNQASTIHCENGEVISADYVVCSVPLGVLKHGDLQFDPPLPSWKQGAISRLGFGTLNKVVLVFKEVFWDPTRDIFGALQNPANRFSLDQRDYFGRRGRFFQWFNCTKTTGLPTLLALMAGDAAFQTEKTSNDELVSEACKMLRSIFGPQIPNPIEAVVTRWGSERFAHGSYSYTSPTFQPDDYEVMAKPVGNVFFAGEHTCGTHPATVHGAYISGLRAASEVIDAMLGPVLIPEPLVVPKDSALKRKLDALQASRDPQLARVEAHESKVWSAIFTQLGERPVPPHNYRDNPYRSYTKQNWELAKKRCEEGRRPGKTLSPNEVKKMLSRMWKETSAEDRVPYMDKANEDKAAHARALLVYEERAAAWDRDSLAFRARYELEHPPPMEDILAVESRGR